MAELKIKADSGGGTVSFKGPSTTTSNAAVQLTLPVDDGTANQYLKTDGSGALSWATVTDTNTNVLSGGTIAGDVTFDGTGGDTYWDESEAKWRFTDNVKATFGTGYDLEIYHDGSHSYIKNNTGQLGVEMGTSYTYYNKSNTGTIIEFRTGGSAKGSIGIGGSDVSFNTSSDYRLKENVAAISDGITRVKQLKPSKFNWISDDTNTLIDGFLAHEVSSVVPNAVTGAKDAVDSDDNPVHQSIDQSKMIPLLTAALKEAITKIETLETKVAALEAG